MSPARPPAPKVRTRTAPRRPAAPSDAPVPGTGPRPGPVIDPTATRTLPVADAPGASEGSRSPRPAVVPRTAAPPAIPPVAPRQVTGAARRDRVVVDQATERFAERVRARRRRAWHRVATGVAILAVVAAIAWVALMSPLLALDPADVTVRGAVAGAGQVVSQAEVSAAVARHSGEPLPRLDTVALREELRALRGVKDVRVMRAWPRGLVITITPREPVAAVPVDGGYRLLDADGVELGTVATAPAGLPVMQVPEDDPRTLASALGVVRDLPSALAAQVTTLMATTQDAVTLKLASGVTVAWGSAGDDALKAEVVQTLLDDASLTGVTTIDVSAPKLPVVH